MLLPCNMALELGDFFLLIKSLNLGQTNKIISFSDQFPKILMRQGGTFFFFGNNQCFGSNAVAAYTRNNHACLRHKCFTDNDRNQQTYGSESGPGNDWKRTQFFFPNVKTINAAVKTHTWRCLRI